MTMTAKSKRILLITSLFIIATGFWVLVFRTVQDNTGVRSGVKIDALSGAEINYDAANSAESPNPNLPYFAGIGILSDFGISDDDKRYIQDVLTNFTLYNLKINKATISFVKDSYRAGKSEGVDNVYSFQFGVNGNSLHTINVTSNFINSTISISISKDSKEAFKRDFDIYSN